MLTMRFLECVILKSSAAQLFWNSFRSLEANEVRQAFGRDVCGRSNQRWENRRSILRCDGHPTGVFDAEEPKGSSRAVQWFAFGGLRVEHSLSETSAVGSDLSYSSSQAV